MAEEQKKEEGIRNGTPELTEERKRHLIKNFFVVNKAERLPYTHTLLIITYISFALAIIFIFYFNTTFFTIIIGGLCIAYGLLHIKRWNDPYKVQQKIYNELPNSQQMDAWLLEDINTMVKPVVIKELSLNLDHIKPDSFILVPYPIFWKGDGIDPAQLKRRMSSEGHYKYSAYKVQVLALTDNYFSFFSCVYDWLENTVKNFASDEFFFDDISSIRNDSEKTNFKILGSEADEKANFVSVKTFKVRNMSGEVITVITNVTDLQHTPKINTNLNQMIQILRVILRNRRYGEVVFSETAKTETKDETPKTETKNDAH